MGKKNTYSYKNQKKNQFQIKFLPVIFILAILPLFFKMKSYDANLSEYSWFASVDTYNDFFLYYKEIWFVLISILMLIVISFKLYGNRNLRKIPSIMVPLMIYIVLALLSSLIGGHTANAFRGGFEQFESILAVMSYGIVVYYCYIFIETENDAKNIMKFFLIGILFMGVIGFFQYIGHDLFMTHFGKELITSKAYMQNNDINLQFGEGRVYLTLFNPNYVGVYVAMITPILLIFSLYSKKIIEKILYIVALALLLVCMVGSQSLAGFVGIIVSFFFLFLFLTKFIRRYYYITVPTITLLVCGFLLINQYNDDFMTNRLKSIFQFTKTEYALKEINTCDDYVEIKYNSKYVKIFFDPNSEKILSAQDEEGMFYQLTFDEETSDYLFSDEDLASIKLNLINFNSILGFCTSIDGTEWYFTNQTDDGTYSFINMYGKLDKIYTADHLFFDGYESYASSRFYIWSRTLPLIKDYIVLGSGQDNFVFAFPQQDHVNLNRYFNNQILTKPHSLYLQIAIQSGVISLIAFLVFYLMYFVNSIRIYIYGIYTSYYAKLGLGIFIGSIAYMICGITNDSSITTAPIFWTLIGIGIVMNEKAKPEILKERELLREERINKSTSE